MNRNVQLLLATGAVAVAAFASPAMAGTDVYVNVGPPPPRYEVVPAPRPGYIWTPGYWDWRNNRHYWRQGYWVRERRGYAYAQPAWERRDDRWVLRRGGWGDRDRDGVPNRYDRHPGNPRRP